MSRSAQFVNPSLDTSLLRIVISIFQRDHSPVPINFADLNCQMSYEKLIFIVVRKVPRVPIVKVDEIPAVGTLNGYFIAANHRLVFECLDHAGEHYRSFVAGLYCLVEVFYLQVAVVGGPPAAFLGVDLLAAHEEEEHGSGELHVYIRSVAG